MGVSHSRGLMASSAVALGAAGVAGLFLPHEFLNAIDVPPAGALPVITQLFGGALLGFAFVNWTAKGALIGGIYNRPVALGNLLHFAVGAITLAKVVAAGGVATPVWVAAGAYTLFAAAFAVVLFGSPVPAGPPPMTR